ncbi:AAA family ATPase [Microvirga splendida]|uniref:AAA family ATPase n=1 Tax=Microvirga splendida TaxID=2795727 RepID=A0ABS0XZE1_9HYPH|nr:AAA family ATPase [Microvirga splendida]MBJ6125425.1 AAA family ATPase [Microvirga splendida]
MKEELKRIFPLRPLEFLDAHQPRDILLQAVYATISDAEVTLLDRLDNALEAKHLRGAERWRRDLFCMLDHEWHDHIWLACACAGVPEAIDAVALRYAALAAEIADWLHRHAGDAKSIGYHEEVEKLNERLRSASNAAIGWGAVAAGRRASDLHSGSSGHAGRIAAQVDATLWSRIFQKAFEQGLRVGENEGVRKIRRMAQARAEIDGKIAAYEGKEPPFPSEPVEDRGMGATKPPDPKGVVVLPAVGSPASPGGRDAAKTLESILGKTLPLVRLSEYEIKTAREMLCEEFPHAHGVITELLKDMRPGEPAWVRPTVLVGAPGAGKSSLARRCLVAMQVPVSMYDAGTSADQAFSGTPRRWSGSHPSFPITAIHTEEIANVGIVVDELEKAGRSTAGSMHDSLLSLLERATAKRWRDSYVDAEVDLSHLSWIFTANALKGIPRPLRNRLRVLRVPLPSREHIPALANGCLREIMRERGIWDEWSEPPLDGEELEAIERACGDAYSIRNLQKLVEVVLDARSKFSSRN